MYHNSATIQLTPMDKALGTDSNNAQMIMYHHTQNFEQPEEMRVHTEQRER